MMPYLMEKRLKILYSFCYTMHIGWLVSPEINFHLGESTFENKLGNVADHFPRDQLWLISEMAKGE